MEAEGTGTGAPRRDSSSARATNPSLPAKDCRRRLADIADAGLESRRPAAAWRRTGSTSRTSPRPALALWPVATAISIVSAVVLALLLLTRATPPAPELRVEIASQPTTDPISLAISPDGRSIAFVGTSDGRLRLWIRSLDSGFARPVPGTDGASLPFWSPDSHSLGFFAEGKLKRTDDRGGPCRSWRMPPGEGGHGVATAQSRSHRPMRRHCCGCRLWAAEPRHGTVVLSSLEVASRTFQSAGVIIGLDARLRRITNVGTCGNESSARSSGGMRQRFGIAQTLIGDPRLIIVD